MSKLALFNWMRANNPHLQNVYLGGSKDELYICYDKAFQPMDCHANGRSSPTENAGSAPIKA
ncbi:Uncharacterised protein [Mannheimia haemolytica]|uniref:Uncharacterized protein n=1 Tax=Mannheimia haemolytica TaxID=75985 RepID=A0A378MWY3_MANHA|nr:Uncharacterised protein [Mannheimia haemolytica]